MNTDSNILVLAPHTDDGELGCGGTIASMRSQGCNVFYIAFSSCESSVPPPFPKDILKKEVSEATRILGIEPGNLFIEEFEVRTFSDHRQAILDRMIFYRKMINPGTVFIPSLSDVHQDHQTIREEATRAFKNCTLLGYELPWNTFNSDLQFFFSLTKEHVNQKINALAAYASQSTRAYFNPEFIKGLACVRGTQAGLQFAEAFEVFRYIQHTNYYD